MLRFQSWLIAVILCGSIAVPLAAQTPGAASADLAARDPARGGRGGARSSAVRLARAPNMFGDSLNILSQGTFASDMNPSSPNEPQPTFNVLLGGNSPTKIAENSSTLPVDRVFFYYNGYQNAEQFIPDIGAPPLNSAFNQYTFGFEKTFFDGNTSIDVRIPLQDEVQFNEPFFQAASGTFGSLAVYLKALLYAEEDFAFGGGLGIGLPTAEDFRAQLLTTELLIENDALHLLPYLGYLQSLNEDWFMQAFLQFDFAASGNPVSLLFQPPVSGIYNEQHLVHVDFAVGRWLYRNECARYLTRVAGVFELHYTATLQDTDVVTFDDPTAFTLSNPANRTNLLNLTGGLQFQLGELSNLRVACVVPVRDAPDRQFTSEIQVSFNRNF